MKHLFLALFLAAWCVACSDDSSDSSDGGDTSTGASDTIGADTNPGADTDSSSTMAAKRDQLLAYLAGLPQGTENYPIRWHPIF